MEIDVSGAPQEKAAPRRKRAEASADLELDADGVVERQVEMQQKPGADAEGTCSAPEDVAAACGGASHGHAAALLPALPAHFSVSSAPAPCRALTPPLGSQGEMRVQRGWRGSLGWWFPWWARSSLGRRYRTCLFRVVSRGCFSGQNYDAPPRALPPLRVRRRVMSLPPSWRRALRRRPVSRRARGRHLPGEFGEPICVRCHTCFVVRALRLGELPASLLPDWAG